MRQVPKNLSHLIVGNGRMSSFIQRHFNQFKVPFVVWERKFHDTQALHLWAEQADYTLLCVHDSAIETFADSLSKIDTQCVHFSGALEVPGTWGFHPLMAFSGEALSPAVKNDFPFVSSQSKEDFRAALPHFTNPYLQISNAQKSLYHSLCVLGGNGTSLLWEAVADEFTKLGIERRHLMPYALECIQATLSKREGRLTGPWYRGDQKTVDLHREQLHSTKLGPLYEELCSLSKHWGGTV